MAAETLVTLEFPNGTVIQGTAQICTLEFLAETEPVATAFGVHVPVIGRKSWRIEMEGIGAPETHAAAESRLIRQRQASGWTCPYCGRPHPQECDKCWDGVDGCGAPKPLLLSV